MAFMRAQGRQLLARLHTACTAAAIPNPPHAATPCDAAAHAAAICRQTLRTLSTFEFRRPSASSDAGLAAWEETDSHASAARMPTCLAAATPSLPGMSSGFLWTPHGMHAIASPIMAGLSAALQGPVSSSSSSSNNGSSLAAWQHLFSGNTLQPAANQPVSRVLHLHTGRSTSQDQRISDIQDIGSTGLGETLHLVKRTYQPSVIIRKRRHGYLARIRAVGGRRVLQRRRQKGRWRPSA